MEDLQELKNLQELQELKNLQGLKKALKTIDNLEEMFKDENIEVIFGLEELKIQINNILEDNIK